MIDLIKLANQAKNGDEQAVFSSKIGEIDQDVKHKIIKALRAVYDPEIPVNLYDLGLIYHIRFLSDSIVDIDMTLTAPNCPVADQMPQMVAQEIEAIEEITKVTVNLVFDPPWSKEKMSEDARLALDWH